jgi:hypothetical protein
MHLFIRGTVWWIGWVCKYKPSNIVLYWMQHALFKLFLFLLMIFSGFLGPFTTSTLDLRPPSKPCKIPFPSPDGLKVYSMVRRSHLPFIQISTPPTLSNVGNHS